MRTLENWAQKTKISKGYSFVCNQFNKYWKLSGEWERLDK